MTENSADVIEQKPTAVKSSRQKKNGRCGDSENTIKITHRSNNDLINNSKHKSKNCTSLNDISNNSDCSDITSTKNTSSNEPQTSVSELSKSALADTCSAEHPATSPGIVTPKSPESKTFRRVLGQYLVVMVLAVVLYTVHQHDLWTHRGFSKFWLNWENIALDAEVCTIDLPDAFQDVFRPEVDCAMCRHVGGVDVAANISPQLFEKKYAYSGRPVLIVDGQQNWSAPEVFSFEFFKNIYTAESPVLTHSYRDCQFFPYKTDFNNLKEVFNMSRQRVDMKGEPWYIGWSNCDSDVTNALRQHYSRPYFLPAASEASKMDWIFMGTPGHGAHLHIDHVGKPSWQAQIRGIKTWTLEPPPECYFQCQSLSVTVHPGNIIVLDTNLWYHKTQIVSEELSITIGSEYD